MNWVYLTAYIVVLVYVPPEDKSLIKTQQAIPVHAQVVQSPVEAAIVAVQWERAWSGAHQGRSRAGWTLEARLYRLWGREIQGPIPLPQLQEVSAHAGKTFVVTDIPVDTLTVGR